MFKKFIKFCSIALIAVSAMSVTGCGEKQTAEQRINDQVQEKVHALTAEERILAETNAKQFFNREFPQTQGDGTMRPVRGMFLDCRPSDSNFNGMVTCHGVMPLINGRFDDKVTRYCGYTPKLMGCSDEDTVK